MDPLNYQSIDHFIQDSNNIDALKGLSNPSAMTNEQKTLVKGLFTHLAVDYDKYATKASGYLAPLTNTSARLLYQTDKNRYYNFWEKDALEIVNKVVKEFSKEKFEKILDTQKASIKNKMQDIQQKNAIQSEIDLFNLDHSPEIETFIKDLESIVKHKVQGEYLISTEDLNSIIKEAIVGLYKIKAYDFKEEPIKELFRSKLKQEATVEEATSFATKTIVQAYYLDDAAKKLSSILDKESVDRFLTESTALISPESSLDDLRKMPTDFLRKHFNETVEKLVEKTRTKGSLNETFVKKITSSMNTIGAENAYFLSEEDIGTFYQKELTNLIIEDTSKNVNKEMDAYNVKVKIHEQEYEQRLQEMTQRVENLKQYAHQTLESILPKIDKLGALQVSKAKNSQEKEYFISLIKLEKDGFINLKKDIKKISKSQLEEYNKKIGQDLQTSPENTRIVKKSLKELKQQFKTLHQQQFKKFLKAQVRENLKQFADFQVGQLPEKLSGLQRKQEEYQLKKLEEINQELKGTQDKIKLLEEEINNELQPLRNELNKILEDANSLQLKEYSTVITDAKKFLQIINETLKRMNNFIRN